LGPTPEKQKRIGELFRRLAEAFAPDALKDVQSELRHLLTTQPPVRKPKPHPLWIIEMVAGGSKNREIAEKLDVTPQLVSNYLHTIYTTIGVDNRLKLVLWYEKQVYEGISGARFIESVNESQSVKTSFCCAELVAGRPAQSRVQHRPTKQFPGKFTPSLQMYN